MPKRGQYKASATADSKRQRAYNSRPEQKRRRAERNNARRELERNGRVRKGDGKDIDHKNHNTSDKSNGNLRVVARGKNRAMNQHDPRLKKRR